VSAAIGGADSFVHPPLVDTDIDGVHQSVSLPLVEGAFICFDDSVLHAVRMRTNSTVTGASIERASALDSVKPQGEPRRFRTALVFDLPHPAMRDFRGIRGFEF
jgi:hypothetical protein